MSEIDLKVPDGTDDPLSVFEIMQRFRADGSCERIVQAALIAKAQAETVKGCSWYLGTMNDGLFIIDQPPQPGPVDYACGLDHGVNVIAAMGNDRVRAEAIVAAHNASEALHLFTSDEAGNCTVCGATKRWQYHVDEEAMRNDVLEEAAQAIECHVPSSVHALQQEMANVVRRMKTD